MPTFTVTSFVAFANLVVAGCRLAAGSTTADRLKAFSDIASGKVALDAALASTGLAAVAEEMTRVGREHAQHFTHAGPAHDDAIALFWQVAPSAFSDPATFAAGHLDPTLTAERMVAAVRAGPYARDFCASPLAEQLFRTVALATLEVMFNRAATVAALSPALWREQLTMTSEIRDTSSQTLLLVQKLLEEKATTVPEITLIAMARKIIPRVASLDEALRALDAAADLAAESRARGEAGSNVDAFVDSILRRLATLTDEGRLDAAAQAADDAVARAEAGLVQLLDAAIRQHLLATDAEAASRHIVRKLTLEAPHQSQLVARLRSECAVWYKRGRDHGLKLDLEVAIALARQVVQLARNDDERGAALDNLASVLAELGRRESGTSRLLEAADACNAALQERTRERVPFDWAATQMNLGTVLRMIGERESDTARLEQAVAALQASLEVWTREGQPLDWAQAQMNLGNALQTVGSREDITESLDAAIAAYDAALEVWTRESYPQDWAYIQANLANALRTLGMRETGTEKLERAVVALRSVLDVWTRETMPFRWAVAQLNLGVALHGLGQREHNSRRLRAAIVAIRAALEEFTRERATSHWANAHMNLGNSLLALGEREENSERVADAVVAFRSALEEQPREQMPFEWARTQSNLGAALTTLGRMETGTARLEEAVVAFRAALEERTPERAPLDWARTQTNLADALGLIARRLGKPIDEALALIDAALEVLQSAGSEPHLRTAEEVRRRIVDG